jgi:hypothetical protein
MDAELPTEVDDRRALGVIREVAKDRQPASERLGAAAIAWLFGGPRV